MEVPVYQTIKAKIVVRAKNFKLGNVQKEPMMLVVSAIQTDTKIVSLNVKGNLVRG